MSRGLNLTTFTGSPCLTEFHNFLRHPELIIASKWAENCDPYFFKREYSNVKNIDKSQQLKFEEMAEALKKSNKEKAELNQRLEEEARKGRERDLKIRNLKVENRGQKRRIEELEYEVENEEKAPKKLRKDWNQMENTQKRRDQKPILDAVKDLAERRSTEPVTIVANSIAVLTHLVNIVSGSLLKSQVRST